MLFGMAMWRQQYLLWLIYSVPGMYICSGRTTPFSTINSTCGTAVYFFLLRENAITVRSCYVLARSWLRVLQNCCIDRRERRMLHYFWTTSSTPAPLLLKYSGVQYEYYYCTSTYYCRRETAAAVRTGSYSVLVNSSDWSHVLVYTVPGMYEKNEEYKNRYMNAFTKQMNSLVRCSFGKRTNRHIWWFSRT